MKPKPLTIYCPSGHRFLAPSAFAGNEVKCPYCGLPTIVPQPGDAAPDESTSMSHIPPKTLASPRRPSSQPPPGPTSKARPHAQELTPSDKTGAREPDPSELISRRGGGSRADSPLPERHSIPAESPADSMEQPPASQANTLPPLVETSAAAGRSDGAKRDSRQAKRETTQERTASSWPLPHATPELLAWWQRIAHVQRDGLVLAVGCVLASSILTTIGGIIALAAGFPFWGWSLLALTVLCMGTVYVLVALPDWTTTRNTGLFFGVLASLCALGTGLVAFAPPERLQSWQLASVHNQALRWIASLTLVYSAITFVLLRVAENQRRKATAFLHVTRRGFERRKRIAKIDPRAHRSGNAEPTSSTSLPQPDPQK